MTVVSANNATAQAAPAAKADLTGKWTFTVQTDAGSGTPTVTLEQKADSLTGHYSSQTFGEQALKGTVKGAQFTFTINASVQGQGLTITYNGMVEADGTLKGTADFGGVGSGTFTAKKQP